MAKDEKVREFTDAERHDLCRRYAEQRLLDVKPLKARAIAMPMLKPWQRVALTREWTAKGLYAQCVAELRAELSQAGREGSVMTLLEAAELYTRMARASVGRYMTKGRIDPKKIEEFGGPEVASLREQMSPRGVTRSLQLQSPMEALKGLRAMAGWDRAAKIQHIFPDSGGGREQEMGSVLDALWADEQKQLPPGQIIVADNGFEKPEEDDDGEGA